MIDKLKGSFKRIQAWVKANPKKSIVIAIVIAVIFYFAIKRGASDTGEPQESGSESLDSLGGGVGEAEGLLGGFGGGGGGGGGGESVPASSSGSGSSTDSGLSGDGGFFGGGDGGFLGSDFTDSFPISDGYYGGFSGGTSEQVFSNPLSTLQQKTANAINASDKNVLAKAAAPIQTQPSTNKNASAMSAATKIQPAKPSVILTPAPKPAVKAVAKPAAKPAPKPAVKVAAKPAAKPKTPAQLLGYPANYTGYIYGIYYVNGYVSAAPKSSKAGIKAK